MELDTLRKDIDSIDRQLAALLQERFCICQTIGQIKKKKQLPLENKEREQAVLDGVLPLFRKTFQPAAKTLFETLFSLCKSLQQ